MSFLDKLERKFGKFAIKNLMLYIVALNGFIYVLSYFDTTGTLFSRLVLSPYMIMKGEFWRLFTFILVPPASTSAFFMIFVLYFYYLEGTGLEQEWGSFKFNLYYLIGILTTIAASFISQGSVMTAEFLNLSLFLAFARIYPDYEILLFFFIPVKVKYLGYINWAFLILSFVVGSVSTKLAIFAALLNYFIFFGKDLVMRRKSYKRKSAFNNAIPKKKYMHKCCVCGITELDDPNMDFRYCSKCSGSREYCSNHLFTHEHK